MLVYNIFNILDALIFLRCILSFLPFNNKFTGWVYMATEPLLSPCRKLMYKAGFGNMPIDFSPIIAILLLQFAQRIINSLFYLF